MDVTHAGSVGVKAARVSVLKVSLGRLRWVPCAIRVDEPTNSLVLFDSKGKNVFPPTPLSGRGAGAVRFSKRAAVGQPNAIVVCDGARRMSEAVAAMRAAERRQTSSGEEGNDGDGDDGGDGEDVCLERVPAVARTSRIIRFRSDEQSSRWRDLINDAAARACADQPPAGPVASRDSREEGALDVDDAGGTAIKIHATLAELSVVVAAPLTPEESPRPRPDGNRSGELLG